MAVDIGANPARDRTRGKVAVTQLAQPYMDASAMAR